MSLPNKIFLVGMPGSGKSTLGSQLAEHANYQFVDLDQAIEKGQGCAISKIFEIKGENTFRRLEALALKKTLTKKNIVVATGGGTPCFFDNMHVMNAHGLTIYLEVSPKSLKNRLMATDIGKRPKLNKIEVTETMLSQTLGNREKYYKQAHRHASGDHLSLEDLVSILKEYTDGK